MPSASQTSSMPRKGGWDLWKILTLFIIPVFGWVVKLEVTNAIQSERIEKLQADVQKNSNIAVSVQQNTTALVKLETKLDVVVESTNDIKKLLASK